TDADGHDPAVRLQGDVVQGVVKAQIGRRRPVAVEGRVEGAVWAIPENCQVAGAGLKVGDDIARHDPAVGLEREAADVPAFEPRQGRRHPAVAVEGRVEVAVGQVTHQEGAAGAGAVRVTPGEDPAVRQQGEPGDGGEAVADVRGHNAAGAEGRVPRAV